MGAPTAAWVARAGQPVTAIAIAIAIDVDVDIDIDIDPQKAVSLAADGVKPAATISDAATDADVLVLMVATAGQAESVLYGDGRGRAVLKLCGVHIAVASEALAYAEALGLDAGATWEVLRHGAAAAFMLEDRGARMVDNPEQRHKSSSSSIPRENRAWPCGQGAVGFEGFHVLVGDLERPEPRNEVITSQAPSAAGPGQSERVEDEPPLARQSGRLRRALIVPRWRNVTHVQ